MLCLEDCPKTFKSLTILIINNFPSTYTVANAVSKPVLIIVFVECVNLQCNVL